MFFSTSVLVLAFSRASLWNSMVDSVPSIWASCFSYRFFLFRACRAAENGGEVDFSEEQLAEMQIAKEQPRQSRVESCPDWDDCCSAPHLSSVESHWSRIRAQPSVETLTPCLISHAHDSVINVEGSYIKGCDGRLGWREMEMIIWPQPPIFSKQAVKAGAGNLALPDGTFPNILWI